jgi:hypothetical protein
VDDSPQEATKTCFVVCPIGPTGGPIRLRSDQILRHVIRPAAEPFGYEVRRSDEIDKPGVITNEVINRVLDSDLVIADLTGLNPNVMYELGVRHATRKHTIHISERDNVLPFDIAQQRVIFVDHHDLDSASECRDAITRQIKTLTDDPDAFDNPVTTAVAISDLHNSDNPLEQIMATVLDSMSEVRNELSLLRRQPSRAKTESSVFSPLRYRVATDLDPPSDKGEVFRRLVTAIARGIADDAYTSHQASELLEMLNVTQNDPTLALYPSTVDLALLVRQRLESIVASSEAQPVPDQSSDDH